MPDVAKISEIISSRFLHDPQFVIEINGQVLSLDELEGLYNKTEITTKDGYKITANFIDTINAAKRKIYQGIAFWQSGRLVGVPSWTLGCVVNIDGRTAIAKRYTIVIQSDDLADLIKEDWSGFIDSEKTNNLFNEVGIMLQVCLKRSLNQI